MVPDLYIRIPEKSWFRFIFALEKFSIGNASLFICVCISLLVFKVMNHKSLAKRGDREGAVALNIQRCCLHLISCIFSVDLSTSAAMGNLKFFRRCHFWLISHPNKKKYLSVLHFVDFFGVCISGRYIRPAKLKKKEHICAHLCTFLQCLQMQY